MVVNFCTPHNRRTPLQAEEALGPISIPEEALGPISIPEEALGPISIPEEALGPISIPRGIEMGPRAFSV